MNQYSISEIRINQFGCWEQVAIPSLTPSMNVIHLDDGGEAHEFAQFLQGMLFGFRPSCPHEGSLRLESSDRDLVLRRQSSGNGRQVWQLQVDDQPVANREETLRSVLGQLDTDVIDRLFFPNEPTNDPWSWLGKRPDISSWLLGKPAGPDPRLQSLSRVSLETHGRLIEQLAERREEIVDAIGQLRRETPPRPAVPEELNALPEELARSTASVVDLASIPEPTPQPEPTLQVEPPLASVIQRNQAILAELQDELRMLERQREPLQLAIELADRWHEMKQLQQRTQQSQFAPEDADTLRTLADEYRGLVEEQREYDRILHTPKKRRSKKKRGRRPEEAELRTLLDQREWVTTLASEENAVISTGLGQGAAFNARREIQHVGKLMDTAEREVAQVQRRIQQFSAHTNFNWQLLQQPARPCLRPELREDSEIYALPPERQLAELKRRRLWIHEEYKWRLRNQPIAANSLLWIAILFCMSGASIFGVLLVNSYTAQWGLAALGLCGIVSSWAMKLSVERRNARQLGRSYERLQQVDREVDKLTQLVYGEQTNLRAESKRAVDDKTQALQLQLDLAQAERKLESARISYRDLIELHGLPATLSPTEAVTWLEDDLPHASPVQESPHRNPKLARWVKRARRLIRKHNGRKHDQPQGREPGQDPFELLERLDGLFLAMRRGTSKTRSKSIASKSRNSSVASQSTNNEDAEFARQELKRIAKRQRSILRKAKADDEFMLDSRLKSAVQQVSDLRRLNSLRLELSVAVESQEDGDEIREILEIHTAADIQNRLNRLAQEREQIEAKITRFSEIPQPRKPIAKPTPPPARPTLKLVPAPPKPAPPPAEDRAVAAKRQRKLDHLRLRLNEVETRLRCTVRQSQALAVARRAAGAMSSQPTSQTMPWVEAFTDAAWQTIESEGKEFFFRNGEQRKPIDANSQDSRLAWLALQLTATSKLADEQASLPLIMYAADLFQLPNPEQAYQLLRQASRRGQQVLLISDDERTARDLLSVGAPVIRVGLQEEQSSQLRVARGTQRLVGF